MYAKRRTINPFLEPESGAALLLYAIFLSLLGLFAMGYFVSTRSLQTNVPLYAETNKARAAASAGVEALARYYAQLACVDSACSAQQWSPQMTTLASGSGTLPVGVQAAAITASTVSNTLAQNTTGTGFQGQVLVHSLGQFGPAYANNESVLEAQFQSLNINGNPNFVIGKNSTGNGQVQTSQPKIIVATNPANNNSIHFNGSSVEFVSLEQFPKIRPENFQNAATMQLLMVNNQPTVVIPNNDLPLYSGLLGDLLQTTGALLPGSGSFSCTLTAQGSPCALALSNAGVGYSDGSWQISNASIPGFYYAQGNAIVSATQNGYGITVAATGTITTSGHGNGNNPATLTPFDATSLGYCATYGDLSPCEPSPNGGYQSIPQLEGLSLVSSGDVTVGGDNVFISGNVATNGNLTLNGGGNKSFGGILVAKNGVQLNGSITLTTPQQANQQATLGNIVFHVVSTRWLPN